MNELEKVAQEEERRLEAFETKRMDKEDGQSRSRQAWDKDLPVSPETVPYVASHRRRRLVKEVYTSFDMYVHSSESPASILLPHRCRSLPLCQSAELVSRCTGYKPNNVCISMERVSGHSVNAPSEPCILLRKGPLRLETQFEKLNVECSKFHGSRGEVSSVTAGLTSVHDVVLVGGSTHIKFSTQESASQELVVLYLTHTEDILPMR